MSLPFFKLKCSACDFKSSTMVLWGARSYESDGRLVPVSRVIGWCSSCNNFAPIEKLPTEAAIAELKAKINQDVSFVHSEKLKSQANRPWYKRLFNVEAKLPDDIRRLSFKIVLQKAELERETDRWRILRERVSQPRCLICGGTGVELMKKKLSSYPSEETSQQPIALGFIHPECGGEIWSEPSKFRASIETKHKVFDIEGHILRIKHEAPR